MDPDSCTGCHENSDPAENSDPVADSNPENSDPSKLKKKKKDEKKNEKKNINVGSILCTKNVLWSRNVQRQQL